MGAMEYNKAPISVREGKGFIDGIEVMDMVDFNIDFEPDVWSGKQVGERTDSTRWLGYKVTGKITRRRSNKFLKEIIMEYKESGKTPELTLQGIQGDENSDYYDAFGTDTVTAVGCVPTGAVSIIKLDSNGDILDDVINFNAKDIV